MTEYGLLDKTLEEIAGRRTRLVYRLDGSGPVAVGREGDIVLPPNLSEMGIRVPGLNFQSISGKLAEEWARTHEHASEVISARHGRFERQGEGWSYTDTSTNGTTVRRADALVRLVGGNPYPLSVGDELLFAYVPERDEAAYVLQFGTEREEDSEGAESDPEDIE